MQRIDGLRVYLLPGHTRHHWRRRNNHGFTMHLKSPAAFTQRSASRALRAFTIMEILVVIAIIGMLVGLAVSNITGVSENAKIDLARVFVKSSISVPLQQYMMHMGDYPSTADGLQSLLTPPVNKADRWRGPYLMEKKIPEDPWGNPYQYRYPGNHNKNGYDIYSLGRGGQEDEKTMIGNW